MISAGTEGKKPIPNTTWRHVLWLLEIFSMHTGYVRSRPPEMNNFFLVCSNSAVFIWVSKSNWFCVYYATRLVQKTRAAFSSGVKPKPIVIHLHAFSRALRQLHVITSCFDWFTWLSVSFVIGLSDYFGFGFTTLTSHTAAEPAVRSAVKILVS